MKPLTVALACLALALLSYFTFPGHAWLRQDSQIYAPVLEHLKDPSLLRNDILATPQQVAFTLYDEITRALSAVTRIDWRNALALQQILARSFGVWGLYLMALALLRHGLVASQDKLASRAPIRDSALALFLAGPCLLGAFVAGPSAATVDLEPVPRAFALPLVIAGIGLLAHRRFLGAGIAGAIAFLYHPPTALPYCVIFCALALWPSRSETARGRLWRLAPMAVACAVLAFAAHAQQGGAQAHALFTTLAPDVANLLRLRSPSDWISESGVWQPALFCVYGIVFAAFAAAFIRVRRAVELNLSLFVLGLPILALLSLPASWLLLDHWRWALVPQLQPLRRLVFVPLFLQFLACAAGLAAARRARPFESAVWFALAYLPVVQPVSAELVSVRNLLVAVALGAIAWLAAKLSAARRASASDSGRALARTAWLALPLAAFFIIPAVAVTANRRPAGSPELDALSVWAHSATKKDAVFHFADAGTSLEPGVFRAQAQRAVYVDWESGRQANDLAGFAEQWWFRWSLMNQNRVQPGDMAKYDALGIQYVVLQPRDSLPDRAPIFQSAKYLVYAVKAGGEDENLDWRPAAAGLRP